MTFNQLKALVLLLAIPVGFALAVRLGREAEGYAKPQRFVRLHYGISPESLYYLPFSMLENVALARWAPGKTIVIVAGNSILNGYGQAERDVWTLRLQEELGDRYVVVNLAFRGALPYEAGALVAESLLRRNYPVVLVSNTSPGTVGRVAGNAYGYLYYDALYKGRLFNHPARDANIAEWEATATPAVRAEQDELRRAARLDANLRFQALWHHVGYRHLFTTWNPHTRPQFWQARASAVDNLPVAPPLAERFRTEVASELTITQGFSVNLAEPDGSGSWRVLGPPAEIVSDLIEDMIPPKMRRHMVMLLTQNAPFLPHPPHSHRARPRQSRFLGLRTTMAQTRHRRPHRRPRFYGRRLLRSLASRRRRRPQIGPPHRRLRPPNLPAMTPSRLRQCGALTARLAIGLTIGFLLHYLLYRLSLPVQPFIYVAF